MLLELQFSRIKDPALQTMLKGEPEPGADDGTDPSDALPVRQFRRGGFRPVLDSLVPTLISSYGVDPDRVDAADRRPGCSLADQRGDPVRCLGERADLERSEACLSREAPGLDQGRAQHAEKARSGSPSSITKSASRPDLDIKNTTTLGLQLITLLGEQLGGQLTVWRAEPTSFDLRFPFGEATVGIPPDRYAGTHTRRRG